jgi:hypothetical protein
MRAIVYAPDHETWVRSELAGTQIELEVAQSVRQLVRVLTEEAPRPQLLVIDLNSVTAAELLHLHSIRDQGWFGAIVALGRVPASLRKSLSIERTVDVGPYKLRPIAALAGQHVTHTMRMPKISG